jgi:two-component system, chemotaxis family, CheB/CheR fusion protein
MKKKNDTDRKNGGKNYTVVVIGAASGGLGAMTKLLEKLPVKTGMAFLYIHYPEGETPADLAARLAEVNPMKIEQGRHELTVEPDTLYVIPANQEMVLSEGILLFTRNNPGQKDQRLIDKFFTSVARNHKGGLMGVILSGEGGDGAGGLKAIKIAGGITFAQDETATFDEMPKSAMATGIVDLVLPPAQIAVEIGKVGEQPDVFTETPIGTDTVSDSDEHLLSIIQLLKKATPIDFTHYKISTIKRRIVRRMLLYKLTDLKGYYEYLRRHASEITVLYHDLLINVTCFFRDGDSMEYLRKSVLPQILRSKSAGDQVRMWVPACSTGEEAYSLAILLSEIQEESGTRIPIQIFGTDLSEIAIAKARVGVYSSSDLSDLSETRLGKYFAPTQNNGYRVGKRIRDLCIFAQHNVFKDPPFSRLDLISCCNFFIYLENVLQQKCTALFYYALNPTGYLVLGKSETVSSGGQQLFSQVEKRFKVYRKKPDASPKVTAEVNFRLPAPDVRESTKRKRPATGIQTEVTGLEKKVDDILYAKYIPAAVVINREMDILQFRGSTNLFLEPPHGKASFNLMKMARPGLTFDLRNCIHKAQSTQQPVRKHGIEFKVRDEDYSVSLEVIPLPSNNEDRLLLVIFEEQGPQVAIHPPDFSRDETVRKLQDELNTVRHEMQAIIDEHEANKEELQSANEEIISSNEELQSINEELETSKEEVESANEELTAINTELQISNEQLLESRDYAEAIFATIREAVVVLSTDFRVKLANMAFYRTFNAGAHYTEGRLLYEIGEGQWNKPEIKELINSILLHDQQFDGYEMQYEVPGMGKRTMLVNGRKVVQRANKQELLLLAFEDITDRRRAELMKTEREEWFRSMANNAPVMIWTAGPEGSRNFFNVTWLTFTGRTMEQEMGDGWIYDLYPNDKEMFLSIYKRAFEEMKPFEIDYRLRRFDGEYRWTKAIGRPTFSQEEQFTGFVGICNEIHDAKLAKTELEEIVNKRTTDLQQVNKELKKSNADLRQFAYVASHDLQEPLRKIMIFSDRLIEGTELPETNRTYIAKISDSAQRMSQLINDLLDFSKATRSEERFTRTDLSAVLRATLADFELLIKEKNAIIQIGELPVIEAIPFQMGQLFHNLLGNALKFSKARTPPVIKVSSRSLDRAETAGMEGLDSNSPYVEILFEDNGIGFANQYAEQIFVLFQRLNGRHEYPGTGIGLALCRKIADNHGGRIFAESIESIHTIFHVILPMRG